MAKVITIHPNLPSPVFELMKRMEAKAERDWEKRKKQNYARHTKATY